MCFSPKSKTLVGETCWRSPLSNVASPRMIASRCLGTVTFLLQAPWRESFTGLLVLMTNMMPATERTSFPSLGLPRGPLPGSWSSLPARWPVFPPSLLGAFVFFWVFPSPLFLRFVIGYLF